MTVCVTTTSKLKKSLEFKPLCETSHSSPLLFGQNFLNNIPQDNQHVCGPAQDFFWKMNLNQMRLLVSSFDETFINLLWNLKKTKSRRWFFDGVDWRKALNALASRQKVTHGSQEYLCVRACECVWVVCVFRNLLLAVNTLLLTRSIQYAQEDALKQRYSNFPAYNLFKRTRTPPPLSARPHNLLSCKFFDNLSSSSCWCALGLLALIGYLWLIVCSLLSPIGPALLAKW